MFRLITITIFVCVLSWDNPDPWYQPGGNYYYLTLRQQFEERLAAQIMQIVEREIQRRHLISTVECMTLQKQRAIYQSNELLTSLLGKTDATLWNFISQCDDLTQSNHQVHTDIKGCLALLNFTFPSKSFKTELRSWMLENHPDKTSSLFSHKAVMIVNGLLEMLNKDL